MSATDNSPRKTRTDTSTTAGYIHFTLDLTDGKLLAGVLLFSLAWIINEALHSPARVFRPGLENETVSP